MGEGGPVAADHGAIEFGERLLTLVESGSVARRSTTYKYALLLALIDACLESTTRSGAAPDHVVTPQLAEKVLDLYWRQADSFKGEVVLKQSGVGQAEMVTLVRRFRDAHPYATPSEARWVVPRDHARLLREIEWKLVEMPVPRLQRLGSSEDRFIYEIGWDDSIKRSEWSSPEFDNRLLLKPGAGESLVRLAGLVRPLIQRQWAAMVFRLNDDLLADQEVEEFLFGAQRVPLNRVRGHLAQIQEGRCFYCGRGVASSPEVDHFLPWIRYPDNGIHNLVLADTRCNNSKRHFLAGVDHLDRWMTRFRDPTQFEHLEQVARETKWDHHPDRTLNVARSVYLRLPTGARLWVEPSRFDPVVRDELVDAMR